MPAAAVAAAGFSGHRKGYRMNELMNIFGQVAGPQSFDQIRISIASPERIRSWSYGEIKKPETINYPHLQAGAGRALLRPHLRPDQGLRVPVRQVQAHEVPRHHLREVRRRGDALEGAARPHGPTSSSPRRWRISGSSSRCEPHRSPARHDAEGPRARPLFENYVVTEPGLTSLKLHQLLGEEDFLQAQDEHGDDSFQASIGAEALKKMLAAINLEEDSSGSRVELKETTSEAKRKKLVKRLKLVERSSRRTRGRNG